MQTYTRNLLTALAIILLFTACAEKQLDELVQQSEETSDVTETEPVQPEEPAVALPGLPNDVAGLYTVAQIKRRTHSSAAWW